MKRNLVDIITMGCSKNLVDSEALMAMFEKRGYHCIHDSKNPQGEIAVINTCGFIEDAKQESINAILEFAQAKEEGRLRKLFVMGCLSQRYQKELEAEIPQVDKFYGKFNYRQLLDDLGDAPTHAAERCNSVGATLVVAREESGDAPAARAADRVITTPRHYAYIKISEGCDRHCAYCAIPIITGKHKSRPMEEILCEVEQLTEKGTKEFQLIAQDLTYYGQDIYGKQRIAELVDRMADIKGVRWIRLHYGYPTDFPYDLLEVMRRRPNVCKYLDIALQHISDNMLTRMRRHITKDETYQLVERIRSEVPGIHLRTTLMVGFPGETDDDFNQLLDFVRWARFEMMGAFTYSEEEGTYAERTFEDDVTQQVKEQRLNKLMRVQQDISAEIQAEKVGKTLRVVVDRKEGDYYVGRTEYSSPEVDPEVLIPIKGSKRLRIGNFYNITITGSEEFDLYGQVDL